MSQCRQEPLLKAQLHFLGLLMIALLNLWEPILEAEILAMFLTTALIVLQHLCSTIMELFIIDLQIITWLAGYKILFCQRLISFHQAMYTPHIVILNTQFKTSKAALNLFRQSQTLVCMHISQANSRV